MVRRGELIGAWLLVAGCTFDTSGQGTAAAPSPGDDDGATSTATTVDSNTDGVTSMPDGSQDGTTQPVVDDGSEPHPAVIISDGPTFMFGNQPFGEAAMHTFTISNDGDGDATDFVVAEFDGAMSLGATDCGDTLAAGASCTVTVQFLPMAFGTYTAELALGFSDAGVAASASRAIEGRGTGRTPNLLLNGGAEEGPADAPPPQDWTIISGSSWTATGLSVPAHTGSRLFRPGNEDGQTFYVLGQLVEVDHLSTWGDAEGLTFVARAQHRGSLVSLDNSWIQLRFGNISGDLFSLDQSGDHDSESWIQATIERIGPVGTYSAQVELVCDISVGNSCDGYFDEVELWAEWEG